jgi:hypothetical protein
MSGKSGSDMSGINIERRGLLVGAGKLAVATMALSLPWVRRASAAEDTIKIGCVVQLRHTYLSGQVHRKGRAVAGDNAFLSKPQQKKLVMVMLVRPYQKNTSIGGMTNGGKT